MNSDESRSFRRAVERPQAHGHRCNETTTEGENTDTPLSDDDSNAILAVEVPVSEGRTGQTESLARGGVTGWGGGTRYGRLYHRRRRRRRRGSTRLRTRSRMCSHASARVRPSRASRVDSQPRFHGHVH